MKNKLTFFAIIFFVINFSCRNNRGAQFEFCPEEFSGEELSLVGGKLSEVLQKNPDLFPILDRREYPAAYEYLTKLMNTLVITPHVFYRDVFEWEVHIVQNDASEMAFFLPGGDFYIYTGLLKFLQTESQLLTVIAHELYYTNSDIILLSTYDGLDECNILGDILIGKETPSDLDIFAERVSQTVFSTTEVAKADSFSVAVLCDFRYDVLGLKDIIEMAENQNDTIQWLQSRPFENLGQRIEYNIGQAANCDLGGIQNQEDYQKFIESDLP